MFLTIFFCRPDSEALEAFHTLIKFGNEKLDSKFILTSTAVAHTFCRNNPQCEKYDEIQNMIQLLTDSLISELGKDLNQRKVREWVK